MARILVIEDEEEIRSMLGQVLEDAGYEVEEAPNGMEGIRLCREKPVDLLITDMIMPKKEGMETILDIKAEFPDVKIIAISGGGKIGPQPYLQIAQGFGAIRVFSKPFRIEELLAAIRRLLLSGDE
ncbi:MAG: response regulator [Desulfobacteraceae bacterium]|jgi:DNA-binding response OmpR family regulator